MPLPYPEVFRAGASLESSGNFDGAFAAAVNLVVLVLNWLHLRKAAVCPPEITLGRPLSRSQWRVVRHLELAMGACKCASAVSATDMGRTAAKMEEAENFF